MSKAPEMGLSGSVEQKQETEQDNSKSEDIVKPVLLDSNLDNQLNQVEKIIDANDTISGQSNEITDSLESEIDALSNLITDTKDGAQMQEDNDINFKLDNNDLIFSNDLQCDTIKSENCTISQDNTKGISDSSEEIDKFISVLGVENNLQEVLEETSAVVENTQDNIKDNNEAQDASPLNVIDRNSNALEEELSFVNTNLLEKSKEQNAEHYLCTENQNVILETKKILETLTKTESKKCENDNHENFDLDNNKCQETDDFIAGETSDENILDDLNKNKNIDQPAFVLSENLLIEDNVTENESVIVNEEQEDICRDNDFVNINKETSENIIEEVSSNHKLEKDSICLETTDNTKIEVITEIVPETVSLSEHSQVEQDTIEMKNDTTEKFDSQELIVEHQNLITDINVSEKSDVNAINDIIEDVENEVENSEHLQDKENIDDVNNLINDCTDISILPQETDLIDALENLENNEVLEKNLIGQKNVTQSNVHYTTTNIEVLQNSNTDALKESITNDDSNNGTLEDVDSIKEDIFAENNGIEVAKTYSEKADVNSIMNINKDIINTAKNNLDLESEPQKDEPEIIEEILNNTNNQLIESLDSSVIETKSENSLTADKVSVEKDLEKARVETPEDLNITLELDEPGIIEQINDVNESTNQIEIKENIEDIASENEQDAVKINIQDTFVQEEQSSPTVENLVSTDQVEIKENIEDNTSELEQVSVETNAEDIFVQEEQSQEEEDQAEFNLSLDLEEHSSSTVENLISQSTDQVEVEKNIEDNASELEQVSVETNAEDIFVQEEQSQEEEDQAEFNLSLDLEEHSSPIDQDLDEKALIDSSNEPDGCDNLSAAPVIEMLEAKEENLNQVLDENQKIDDAINDSQNSTSQEGISDFNVKGGNFDTDFSELIGTETNIEDSEHSNLPQMTLSPNREPQEPSLTLDTLEFISIEQEKEDKYSNYTEKDEHKHLKHTEKPKDNSEDIEKEEAKDSEQIEREEDKESEHTEKDEDISLIFEDSSKSPSEPHNDKYIDSLDDKYASNDIIEESNKASEDVTECNEPISDEIIQSENDFESEKELKYNVQSLEEKYSTDKLQNVINTVETEKEINKPSTEISELESAVKFLQESEEQEVQDVKMDDASNNKKSSDVYISVVDNECEITSEIITEHTETILDPIAISEAEIISEAAKLESERKEKLELEQQTEMSIKKSCTVDNANVIKESALPADNLSTIEETEKKISITPEIQFEDDVPEVLAITQTKDLHELETVEKTETSEMISDQITISKSSLVIQKDIQQRLESPERLKTAIEPKISETPKKENSEKQQHLECENVGSPRIILKIAKAAIADCSEPRSPKSPKIRSAANSPNPEESSGHKLGKIKLKLSKSGHPSIISNDNYEEAQWHTENTSSSSSSMKIKITKTTEVLTVDESKNEDTHSIEETRKTETPIGMKIKFSKSGDASIVQQDSGLKEIGQETKQRHKQEAIQETSTAKKQDSPSIGMKIKLSKSGDASIIPPDEDTTLKPKDKIIEEVQESVKRTESPIGMKIKFSKSGDASVISNEPIEPIKEAVETGESLKRTDSPIGMKIKLAKTKDGNASIISSENIEEIKVDAEGSKKIKLSKKREIYEEDEVDVDAFKQQEITRMKIPKLMINETETTSFSDISDESTKASLGVKIKLSKTGDASVVQLKKEDSHEVVKKLIEQPIGMKIKLSKTGDPSIIHPEIPKETEDVTPSMKTKHSKNKDHGTTSQQKAKDDSHIEMKIKLSKTGHPTIITNEAHEDPLKVAPISVAHSHKHKDLLSFKESTLKALKKSHSDVTIEPVKAQVTESNINELQNKRKEITIAPVESKKTKLEVNLKQMFPDITIQPVAPAVKKDQLQHQELHLDSKGGSISQQQMNVINQEISITQICSLATGDTLKVQSEQKPSSSPFNSDCEIIEPQPELIIVNENSSSSQDIMIIEELPVVQPPVKIPKKRGRPRRNPLPTVALHGEYQASDLAKDPLSFDQPTRLMLQQKKNVPGSAEGSERPRRTCRSQKSYAPPKRGGRGRGRGKRKNEAIDIPMKKQRIDQDLTALEKSTTAIIALQKLPLSVPSAATTVANVTTTSRAPELFKALSQPTLEQVAAAQSREVQLEERAQKIEERLSTMPSQQIEHDFPEDQDDDVVEVTEMMQSSASADSEVMEVVESAPATDSEKDMSEITEELIIVDKNIEDKSEIIEIKITDENDKQIDSEMAELKDPTQENQNWLAPSIKKISNEPTVRVESISTLTVIDEETRMSAESGSRSQTPARNIVVPGTSETFINEESQGSVLSTATTESEKVKVRTRRMEIIVEPGDEGPFTVDKLAEYEWSPDKKDGKPVRGETYMIQEQISQYLGVKSFKRKYPDLKRRMVDMEERNYLRENGLVSESMCDMGLTAVSSSEVLDIMCNDFPEQYEEYRKYIREKAAKEHLKKQKELSAAANAERNRIDLAEMAMQSAISYNSNLNKTRQDTRKCSLDLQTFTVQVPLKRAVKYDPTRRINHYPVSVIPGQYTDYYREYKPAELRYYPINTVLYGPMRPNERKFDSQSDGSQSDSDSDSSSDDSSSSSSDGTQDSQNSQSTMEEVDMEIAAQSDLKCKMCLSNLNKSNRPEVLVQCGTCSGNVHPSCIDLTVDMVPHIRAYAWQCTDCKTCAQCHDPADEDKMLFCDMCDRGYHIYCVGLRRVPQGRWHCQECAVCSNCGAKEPGGATHDRNSVAQWQHEYKRGDKNTRVYVSTFCVPCSKLWHKGRYCPHCNRCHNVSQLDLDPNLIHCGACDKYLHLECVEIKELNVDKKNYLCGFCSSKQHQEKSLISKTLKT